MNMPAHIRKLATNFALIIPLFDDTIKNALFVNFFAFLESVFKIGRRNSLFDSVPVTGGLPEFAVLEIALEHAVEFSIFIGRFDSDFPVRMVTYRHPFANIGPRLHGIDA